MECSLLYGTVQNTGDSAMDKMAPNICLCGVCFLVCVCVSGKRRGMGGVEWDRHWDEYTYVVCTCAYVYLYVYIDVYLYTVYKFS